MHRRRFPFSASPMSEQGESLRKTITNEKGRAMMTTVTKKNTRRALNVFLLLVGAVGFFMALGKALSTLIADEDKSKNSNATEMLDRFIGDSKDHGESQYQLGMMYRHGEGCETNNEDAVKCFRKAAAKGHVFAQLELGTMYFFGDGVVTNNHEAVKWLSLSAEQGNCPAKMFLNIMYIQGMYAEADLEEVSKWYHHMENDQCDSLTPYLLGIVYLNGGFVGVETNRQEATKWLYRAAANGCIEAKYELGLMCHEGDGTVTNSQEATEWYRKATEKRNQHMSTSEAYAMVISGVFGLDRKDTTPKTEMKQTVKMANVTIRGKNYSYDDLIKAAGGNTEETGSAPSAGTTSGGSNSGSGDSWMPWVLGGGGALLAHAITSPMGDHAESQCAPSKLASKDEFAKMKAKSVKWIHHAAENGTAEASYILGLMYLNGCGVDKNGGEAKKWFYKSGYQSVER